MPSYPAPGTPDWSDDLQAYIDGQDATTLAAANTHADNADAALQASINAKVSTVNSKTPTAGDVALTASDVGAAAASHTHDWTTGITGKPAFIGAGTTAANARSAISAADDTAVVKLAGAQTITGTKTFSAAPSVPDSSFTIAKTSGLQAALDAKLASSGAASTLGVDDSSLLSRLPDLLAALGYSETTIIGAADPLPVVSPNTVVYRISGSVAGALSVNSLLIESKAGGTSVVSTALGALGAGAVVPVLVTSQLAGGTSGSPSPVCTGLSGAGLTWQGPFTLPFSSTSNGQDSAALFLGKGTGTAGALTATFATAPTTVQFRVAQVVNANGTMIQQTSAQKVSTDTAPAISLVSTPTGNSVVFCWIVQNNSTNAQTPGTGYTEIGSAVNATGIRVSGEYQIPGPQSASWTTASGYQKLLVIAEIS